MTAETEVLDAAGRGSRVQDTDGRRLPGTAEFRPPCPRCTGHSGVHFLTCPTLRLAPGWSDHVPDMTPNMRQLLHLLKPGPLTAEDLAGLWPSRSLRGIGGTLGGLASRGMIAAAPGGHGAWELTGSGRRALEEEAR